MSADGKAPCRKCPAGKADKDRDPTTECDDCSAGSYSGEASLLCAICKEGQADLDGKPSTSCKACSPGKQSTKTSCDDCKAGAASLRSEYCIVIDYTNIHHPA